MLSYFLKDHPRKYEFYPSFYEKVAGYGAFKHPHKHSFPFPVSPQLCSLLPYFSPPCVSKDMNPTDPTPYLHRSISYFDMGQYSKSIEDFNHFTSQTDKPPEHLSFSSGQFTLGFAKGLPQGIYKSGRGMILFLGDLITHPIHSATQIYEALSTLVRLAHGEEWLAIKEILCPEIHQLIKNWDVTPSVKRGEIAGYIFGKYGADILMPGAIAKIASKSAKSAKELTIALKTLHKAEGTLVVETATGINNPVKIGQIISNGKKTAFLGEELGFTAKEMGQLKQAGMLEKTVTQTYKHLTPSMQESMKLFDQAQQALKAHKGFMPETRVRELINQTGIKTFPRPKGIPENFKVKLSDRGVGMEYVHPVNNHLRVRVMPGKPHSPFPHQQRPYVVQMKDGTALDKFGKKVAKNAPEAHIPLDEFIYRD